MEHGARGHTAVRPRIGGRYRRRTSWVNRRAPLPSRGPILPKGTHVSLTCAETTRDDDEPIAGTAPMAIGWLLVERDGAWGRDALTESGLDPDVGAALAATCKPLPVKAVVIRRPGPHATIADGHDEPRTVVLAHTGSQPWAERLTIRDDRELLELDPGVTLRARPPGLGEPVDGPLLLVCTHGKRDRCCATFGRPLVDTLAALHPEETWEVSHIGGHRFAGNLLVLPEGLAYGGLDVASGLGAAASHVAGRLDLEHLRGRTALQRASQAAEIAVRRHYGIDRIGGMEVVARPGASSPDAGTNTDASDHVTVDVEGARVVVEVVRRAIGPRRLSCDAGEPEEPYTYEVIDIGPVAGTARATA